MLTIASRFEPEEKYRPLEIWPDVIAPSPGWVWSTPSTETDVTLIERGPCWPPPAPPKPPPSPPPPVGEFCGTVPETCTDESVKPPATDLTFAFFEIEVTSVAGKESCEVAMNESRVKCVPGLPRFCRPSREPPFSFCSWSRSFCDRPRKPCEELDVEIGRDTDMSVPTPVSGASTLACALSRPVESALTVTTRPTPTARPSAVRSVRPFRRRNSENM